MAAHQHNGMRAQRLGQRLALGVAVDQHVVVLAGLIANLIDRHACPEERGVVEDRPQRRLGNAERDDGARMAVNDGIHVGPQFVDLAVDEPLGMQRAPLPVDCVAVEVELHDVVCGHIGGRNLPRPRHEESVGVLRMPDADMAVRIEHVLIDEDTVGEGKLGQDRLVNAGKQGSRLRSRVSHCQRHQHADRGDDEQAGEQVLSHDRSSSFTAHDAIAATSASAGAH